MYLGLRLMIGEVMGGSPLHTASLSTRLTDWRGIVVKAYG
ncbi:hypothetical protein AM1_B0405 (plasmid) [Acaryochloris marina MBIC11017]|uniref:Uncharacterized protein n=1 Tax=Acaryochloris marina (strain MBIC 11017) TaxID=329726 RepID=A8ZLU6_ACAM1|nr:hypothetical protein AM1_B0405 [Acaryochloris marina MBIC11017]